MLCGGIWFIERRNLRSHLAESRTVAAPHDLAKLNTGTAISCVTIRFISLEVKMRLDQRYESSPMLSTPPQTNGHAKGESCQQRDMDGRLVWFENRIGAIGGRDDGSHSNN